MSSAKHHLEPNDDNDQVGFFITTIIKVLIRRHCVLRQTDSRKKFKSLHYVDPGLRLLESTPVTNAENIGCGMFIMKDTCTLRLTTWIVVTLKDIIRHVSQQCVIAVVKS